MTAPTASHVAGYFEDPGLARLRRLGRSGLSAVPRDAGTAEGLCFAPELTRKVESL